MPSVAVPVLVPDAGRQGWWLLAAPGFGVEQGRASALGLESNLFNLPDPFPLSSVCAHSCSCLVGKTYMKTTLSHFGKDGHSEYSYLKF